MICIKKVILIIFIISIFISINKTICYFNTSDSIINTFNSKEYNIRFHECKDANINDNLVINNNSIKLPVLQKEGYEFLGFYNKDNTINYTAISNISEINNKDLYAKWKPIDYELIYNYDDGITENTKINYNIESIIELPNPTREGYTFLGWIGKDYNEPTKNIVIKNSIGNQEYKAIWDKNKYNVNYYVNNNLWMQKTVGYNEVVENISGQAALDDYHKFNKWNNWQRLMPAHNLDLYANITNTYCRLTTGHGPYQNATELLKLFERIGYKGEIKEAKEAPGNYLVITNYSLTRENIDSKKELLETSTSYNSYSNYPYLYWLGIECNNGKNQIWYRNFGQLNFS